MLKAQANSPVDSILDKSNNMMKTQGSITYILYNSTANKKIGVEIIVIFLFKQVQKS